MTAAGWWCQFSRYPAFRGWTDEEFIKRHTMHTLQISLVVIPGMILQIAGSVLLQNSTSLLWLKVASGVCLAGSLVPTFLVSGPIHGRLSHGKLEAEVERLIRTNLPRTLFWTVHCGLAIYWLLLGTGLP